VSGSVYVPPREPRGCGRVLGCGCGGLLLIIVGLVVADLAIGNAYRQQVEQKLMQLRAAGEPMTGADLAPPPVPDAENAAPLYLKAAAIVKAHEGSYGTNGTSSSLGPGAVIGYAAVDWDNPKHMAALAHLVRQDREAVRLVRTATDRPQCRFDIQWQPTYSALFPQYAKMRSLARFEAAAAAAASAQGDQGAALEWLRAGFVGARRTANDPTVIALLVTAAIDSITLRGAEYVLDHGTIPEGATRQLAQELGRADYSASIWRAYQGERVMGLESFDLVTHPSGGVTAFSLMGLSSPSPGYGLLWFHGSPLGRLTRPWLYKDELLYLSLMDRMQAIAPKPWPQARPLLKKLQADADAAPPWAAMTELLMPVMARTVDKAVTTATRRDLLQVALGLKLYRQRHGRYPDRLDALRETGWSVPNDRFSGKPLIYRRQGDRFLLYSVGQDMKDDGGRPNWVLVRNKQRKDALKQRYGDTTGDLVWMWWDRQ
jgi:hypothetical protein